MGLIRTALVTGASSGFGEEFARALAARGCAVVLVARREERLKELAARLAEAYGTRTEVHAADLSDPVELAGVERRLADPGHPVDLLVNNAGMGESGPLAEQSADDQERVVRLNVIAPIRLTRAVAPGLLERGRGGVINVASAAAMLPGQPDGGVYSASKAFLGSYGESLAAEFAARGLRSTTVWPGFSRTDMTGGLQDQSPPSITWVSVERVVADTLRAFAAGRPRAVPGAQYKLADVLTRLLPLPLLRAVMRRSGGV
jgi:hypothetical protein